MAAIYTPEGNTITAGLQSHTVCDDAFRQARMWADLREESVVLIDGDEIFTVHPDGTWEDGAEGDWEVED